MGNDKKLQVVFDQIKEYYEEIHKKNQRKIRVGLRVNILLPLVFLIISFMTKSSKLVFLVLWVVSLFGIAFYLLYIEFTDFKQQKTLRELGVKEEHKSLIGTEVVRSIDEFAHVKFNVQKIILSDVKRLSKNVVAIVVIMGLTVIPCLYAWFNILSNWDPYGPKSTRHLQVAVASSDKGTSIGSRKLNVGKMIISNLKENKTIDWQFTDTTKEAIDGVYAGDYYAALVIDDDFSKDMISFLDGKIKNPKIIYYENEKKNAIAPKITAKVKTSIELEVDKAFVSTIAKNLIETGDYLAKKDGDGEKENVVVSKLETLKDDLNTVELVLDSYAESSKSLEEAINTGKNSIDSGIETGKMAKSVVVMGKATIDAAESATNVSDVIIQKKLTELQGKTNELKPKLKEIKDKYNNVTADAKTAVDTFTTTYNTTKSTWESFKTTYGNIDTGNASLNQQIQNSIAQIDSQFASIDQNLNEINAALNNPSSNLNANLDKLQQDLDGIDASLEKAKELYSNSVMPKLDEATKKVSASMAEVSKIIDSKSSKLQSLKGKIGDSNKLVATSRKDLIASRDEVRNAEDKLDKIIEKLKNREDSDTYKTVIELLKKDPAFLADFISSPVDVNEKFIYPVENNGSMTAPFYIVLSIWVGALIMSTILKTEIKDTSNLKNLKTWECFVGRFFVVFVTGQIQTVITVFGALFFVGIQCKHPIHFMIACLFTAFVFDLLLYSFTYSFGNIGEALSVILMVIQVAGAGGTFPIEVLPKVFQSLYRFMPFNYAMNALRECIAGFYGYDYEKYLFTLIAYVVVACIIGICLYGPCKKLNDMVEKSKEESGLLI